MSTPPQPPQQPDQPSEAPASPSAYPYPHPQSPGPAPVPPAAPGQQNFYGQPTLVGQPGQPGIPGQPGPPQSVNPYAQPGPYPAIAPPPGGGSGGRAGRAVLWAAVGAVVASAAWAGGVFLLGSAGKDADLRGYTAPSNFCNSADYSSFKTEYPDNDGSPTHTTLKADALDEGYCSLSLKKTTSSYADAYLSVQVDLHKKTDPGPEFTATWENYGDSHTGYDVDTVPGIGDEAYLVSEDTTSGSTSGSLYATIAVRDGWVTYTMSYSAYLSSYDDDKDPPTLDEVTDWLKTDSKSTLEGLKD
ncbi:hypothetical protein OG562_00775 [Streptomyces sp. NBC_01275]|uniref:hypothetical protein n=1 Tax=Streptomyces sp. NBC_01275 TaxID=2903807 RepID=UPI00225B6D4A|nr:hypothetical protein [Streptomyces sp. NBC_01275]MCX4759544.1 hypothetical protein [Streptomyces sp. NBC_01275]